MSLTEYDKALRTLIESDFVESDEYSTCQYVGRTAHKLLPALEAKESVQFVAYHFNRTPHQVAEDILEQFDPANHGP